MSTISDANRLAAFNESIRQGLPQIVSGLRSRLGAKLVAYIANVTETRAVRSWADGERVPAPNTERRLRLAERKRTVASETHHQGCVLTGMVRRRR